ncbi:MAG: CusA/CzcA family heavy metal efflux RND transporter [Gemmatimonadetes bacterium]|nr:efflux RND transporter permease subunit [Gemmatimonadota bacterium]NIR78905.1 efflux RND transporter permease subunit [Gemmatimonadota bacterium]NIT87540.1 efflux RND transporter permease subunit [Gemmatimonadota bacterium]NIU31408.1 efflux RND transporter permease subunit [Gemmatimonadota bacterium]NIU36093.1 CusA/CzcA family heavy metal efflux RND transporter [Gemmatimonadota bacterium]
MLRQAIEWSVRNKFLVLVSALFVAAGGIVAMGRTPLEALPDLSDVQVIVRTDYPGQAPQIVEDQVTYPVASEMLKVPGARTVRGYSFFGTSFVYVIFDDGTDLYWARSRVLEYLSGIRGNLPEAAQPSLGPDATGLGWVYQYVLEDTTGTRSLADLRSYQDWYLRYQLTSVSGVSEVATVGGYEQVYEVTVDPPKLRAYGIAVTRVMEAIRASNEDVGAMVLELAEREYMIRGLGYLQSLEDIEQVVVAATGHGTPVRVADVADVRLAPDVRRGVADLNGRGDVVGGIVVMRFGENALATIERVKAKLAELESGLPEGLVVTPVYDRSDLIHRAIETLKEKLLEESLVVALVTVIFLFHVRSALVAILTLPLGILMAFIAMRFLGIGADIMSLGGIAIAIGAMIGAAVVMIENMHKHLERAIDEKRERARTRGIELPGDPGGDVLHTRILTTKERWDVVVRASREVGPALFFSLLIITVSFLPVFSLEAQEGRLFKPLAWTKTLSMAAAALLSITLVPVTMGLFVRGRIHREEANPVNRLLVAVYRPALEFVLRYRWPALAAAGAVMILTAIPMERIGSEFMPPLNEGTILYMPTTLPGISVAKARVTLQRQDSILATFPEVQSVFGKAGRATTATDPAPLSMFETTIVLKDESEWREGMTYERLVDEMDRALRFPGVSNSWTMPIKGRIDMLATGIRTPVGVKIFGPDLDELERLATEVEAAVRLVPGTRSAFGERVVSGSYLDIEIDRDAAARYGLNVRQIQMVIASAVGGMAITRTVEGRERYAVRVRYPQELRDQPEKLAEILVPVASRRGGGSMAGMAAPATMAGMGEGGSSPGMEGMDSGAMPMTGMAMDASGTDQIPLGQVARIRTVGGPMAVKTEQAFPTAWVFVDVEGCDLGSYVTRAREMVSEMVPLPPGYSLTWSGQYEYMERAKERLALVVPATLLIIFLLLYLNFGAMGETLIVMLSLPFSLVGGVLIMAILGFNWSVATGVGFIALAGVAAEIGVIMLLYLGNAWKGLKASAGASEEALHDAVIRGAALRVRPIVMTVTAIVGGLLPIFWGHGTGATVMRRIAAPMVGGMLSATVLTLLVIPAIYSLWQEAVLRRERTREAREAAAALPALEGAD